MARLSELHGCPLIERIGEGGIADVFRTELGGRELALKVLRDADRASMRKRFLREGRLLQRLSHPSLLRCVQIFEGDQPALALELLRGEPLDERIARRPLDGEEATRLAGALLRVLSYLHEHGIVHRDVKASNIYLCADNRVVLMDLGLAADPSDPLTTTLGDVLGTYAYMAPEQIAGAESDHRCDLYSLGVTLYEAVCGARPYAARSAAGWLAAHRAGVATPLGEVASGVPPRLANLVDRLMARDPAARPPSAAVGVALLTGEGGARSALRRPPLLGREGARGALEAVIDARGGLRVTGPLGSGFGPLAQLTRRLAAERHVEVISLRCRGRMRATEVVAHVGREIARFGLPERAESTDVEALLRDLAAEGGVLLLAEEVDQLGPEASRALLTLSAVPGVIAIHFGVDLAEAPGLRAHVLRPLTATELQELVREMLHTRSIPPGLDGALRLASGGLAAHAVALLREQVEAGVLWCEGLTENGDSAWRWNATAGLVPGESSRRVLERVLRRLPAEARLCLQALAVADDPLPLDSLHLLLECEDSHAAIGPLVRQGLAVSWSEGGEDWVAVARSAVEVLARAEMPEGRRRRLHLALADAVARRPRGEWEERFLIFHRALGTRTPEAEARLVELGEQLARSGRPTRALRALDAVPADAGVGLMARRACARAEALRVSGRLREALDALAASASLAQGIPDGPGGGRIDALELELLVSLGSVPSDTLVQRLSARGNDGDPAVLYALGALSAVRGQFEHALRLYEAAVASSPSPHDRLPVAARAGAAYVAQLRGQVPEAERRLLALVRELHGRDRRTLLASSYLELARVQRLRGQFSRALASVAIANELHGRTDVPAFDAAADVVRGWALAGAGELVGATEALQRVAGALGAGVQYEVRALYFEVLAEVRRASGDAPSTLAAHLAGIDAARATDDVVRVYFHEAMAGVRTANARLVNEAVGRLMQTGARRHLAMVYLVGAQVGRDPEVLEAAEREARLAEDPALQIEVLHALHTPSARTQARVIARGLVDGLDGGLRDVFQELAAVRWALEEPRSAPHDRKGGWHG